MRLLTATICSALAASIFAQYTSEYASGYGSASSGVFGGVGKSWNPEVPVAPPRVPATRPSFGYRPPPPPALRDVASEGKCKFDATKWRMEPQSAVANAIMFDRTTGISCEECLLKCTQIQAETTQWVCRTLTYDNRWKICDLFAINGTGYPFFLTDYSGRDYFVYLNARAASAAELSGDTEENARGNSVPQTSAPVYGAPSGAVENVYETKSEYEVTDLRASGSSDGAIYGSTAEGSGYEDTAAYSYGGESDTFRIHQPSATASNSLNYRAKSRKSKVKTSQSSVKISKSHVETSAPHTQSHTQTSDSIMKQRTSSANEYQAQAVLSNAAGRTGVGLCHEGEEVRYVALNGRERTNPGSETHFVNSNSGEKCIEACDDDELITCESLVLTPSGCELSTTRASHADAGDLTLARNSTYLEKVCVPSVLAEGTEKIWPAIENYILVGHVLEVTDAPSFAECLIACLHAEQDFGFLCKSAMWYPVDDDQNCLLNSESRATQPDVFVAEDQGVQMLYFDIPRDESFIGSNTASIRLRDEPLNGGNSSIFTHWSSCNKNSTGMRHRYLKCKDRKDIRKCPKESVTCRGLPVKSLKFECIAVRDSLGRKRCPHGIQMLPDGQRQYCKHPVDCH